MTIVHASVYASEYGGNFIASLSRLRDHCLEQGLDFAAVFPDAARTRPWCEQLARRDWKLHFLPSGGGLLARTLALNDILARERAKLVHTHFSELDAPAWAAARLRGIPVVWHLHSDFPVEPTLARRLKDRLKFGVMSGSAHLFLVNEHMKERPLRAGAQAARLQVILNGVDFSRIRAAPGPRKPSTVLLFGWHPEVKGVDVALSAFERAPGLTLLLVGGEATREAVRRRYPGGAPAWLRLVPPAADVSGYLGEAGIFLSASRREGFPYSVVEASAAGCLPVCSDIPALSWMKDGMRVWWFRSEDPDDLARRLLECAALPEDERLAAAEANARLVRAKLPADRWAAEVVGAYRRIWGGEPKATERRTLDEVAENLPKVRRAARIFYDRVGRAAPVARGARVLDVGAAAGAFVAASLELGYRCEGAEPWDEARANAARLGRRLGLELPIAEGVAEALPYPDGTFDVVRANSVIEHVADAEKAFAEAYRVLKPGGVFWFSTASSMCPKQNEIRGFPLFGWYPDALKRRIMLWAKERRPELIGHTSVPALHWFTPWKARRMLRDAGFVRVLDRWDLRGEEEGHALLLKIIRSCAPFKLAADVVVPDCSYAAVKGR